MNSALMSLANAVNPYKILKITSYNVQTQYTMSLRVKRPLELDYTMVLLRALPP